MIVEKAFSGTVDFVSEIAKNALIQIKDVLLSGGDESVVRRGRITAISHSREEDFGKMGPNLLKRGPQLENSGVYVTSFGADPRETMLSRVALWDEVDAKAPCLFISNFLAAQDYVQIKGERISHVVNCAPDSCSNYHEDVCEYHQVPVRDYETEDIKKYFEASSLWIKKALESGKGNVLIHCGAGISRSVSIAIAYLMRYHDMDYEKALGHIRKTRFVAGPNMGFKAQLEKWREETKHHFYEYTK